MSNKVVHKGIVQSTKKCYGLATRIAFTIAEYNNISISSCWESVVGLEIHAQILSKSKLFSASQNIFGAHLNSCVSLFDASIPGTLPVLNKKCVEAGIKTALALGCQINPWSMFDRKHYFYADLPAGYQITQQRCPLAKNGTLTFPVFVPGVTKKPYQKSVRLHQLQLEQDSGKSLHDEVNARSLVDLNRAGAPLMELVFDPNLSDGEEAAALVKELVLILKRIETCSCRMEEGVLRVDANVSIHKQGEPLGVRTEIKNIGSIRGIAQAISYEIGRQKNIVERGGKIHNETRSWDATLKKTITMRDKEVQQDYRFMPEPNLPPLHVNIESLHSTDFINVMQIKSSVPELPEETRNRLIENHGVSQEHAIIIVNEPILLEFFERVLNHNPNVETKVLVNLLINNLLTLCNKTGIELADCKITVNHLSTIVDLLKKEIINLQIVRIILNELQNSLRTEITVEEIIDAKDLKQINDKLEIERLCKKSIERNPKAVKQYKEGKQKTLYAIAGDVAKATGERVNMSIVVDILKTLLNQK